MKANCIDISHYQGKVDFGKVASAGIEYLILKCSEGTGVDSTFDRNYKDSEGLFKAVGCYIFNRATSVSAAEKEARFAVQCLKDKRMDLGVWLDVEATSLREIGKTALNKVIDTEAAILREAGFKVGVYTGYAWYRSVVDVDHLISKYPLWLARYANDGYYHESLTTRKMDGVMMWQYSGCGKVDGIKGNVDMDLAFCDPAQWWNMLPSANGYAFPDFVLGLRRALGLPLSTVADDELLGATITISTAINYRSPIVKYLQKYLTAAGFNLGAPDGVAGKAFQKAVADFQTRCGIIADGVVAAKGDTWKALLGLPYEKTSQQPANDNKNNLLMGIRTALGVADPDMGVETVLAHTITVSKTKNSRSKVVKPLQELLNFLGYSCGTPDGIAGSSFDKAVRKYQKDNGLVCDGEITAKGNTWKTLLSVKG